MKEITSLNQAQILETISRMDFFKNFSEYEKKRVLAHHAHIQSFNMGEYIIREGSQGDGFFLILSGEVIVVRAGKSEALATLGTGEFFGEVGFLLPKPRTSNIIAKVAVISLRVNNKLMESLGTEIREKIKDQILWRLLDRLDGMNQLIAQLSTRYF